MSKNVYVTRVIPKPGLDIFAEAGVELEVNPYDRVLTRKELIEAVKGRDGVLCLLTDVIDGEVMDAAGKNCKGFANYAVGYNNIDVPAATRRRMAISNTPGVLTDATADLAWSLLMSASRRIVESDAYMRTGNWQGWGPMQFLGADITGATLGLIGAGRVGMTVAKRAKGFDMNILYFDVNQNIDLEKTFGAKKVDLDTLLRDSDFVSIHVALTEQTKHLIGKRELSLMKPTAVLINTSRGPTIDEKALVEALRNNKIFAAGLDVYENEPKMTEGLKGLHNAVVVPHIGSATIKTRAAMATMAAANLLAMLKGECPPNCVNQEIYQ
jgi:glyoxylate reductase